jgi:hypothetical protein
LRSGPGALNPAVARFSGKGERSDAANFANAHAVGGFQSFLA